MFESQMTTKRTTAPITVFTNGNKYDAKRVIFNPKYVRSFDALLDQLTQETNATCAVRRIYTPHGRRQVGNLSAIEPGGMYVAVSQGRFKKMPYGQRNASSASAGTTTTKSHRRKAAHSRLQESYEDQLKTQKTIYVHRNGSYELPTQIFFTKKLLRTMDQVLDIIQEKLICERAIVTLRKLNGVTITEVAKLQPEGRYVAVEQGQRFRRIAYDQVEGVASSPNASPRKQKLPLITNTGLNTWRSTSEGKAHTRLPSNESNQEHTSRGKPKLKLPTIKRDVNEPRGFQVIYGYPKIETTTYRFPEQERHNAIQPTKHYHKGIFYATGAQQQNAAEIHDDKRVRVDKPLDMTEAREVEEELDGVSHHGNNKHMRRDQHAQRPPARTTERQGDLTLPDLAHVPKPPTKPSIAHPRRHRYEKSHRGEKPRKTMPVSIVNDQRLVSRDNNMANKQYVVTREQRLLMMGNRDGREPANNVVHVYAADSLAKGLEQRSQEVEKRKRIEEWVDHTVEEKEKEDEIAALAKHLVLNAILKAGGSPGTDGTDKSHGRPTGKKNVPSFCDDKKTKGIKYHRVFGT